MTGAGNGRTGSVDLDPSDRDQPAGRIFALVLRDLLEELRSQEAATLSGDDPDALHDHRVALRRARSVLAAGRRVYPSEELELLRASTAELAAVSSPVRDLDVMLEGLDEHTEDLLPTLRRGADQLREVLEERREKAHAELVAFMRSEAHDRLVRCWQTLGSVHRIGGSEPGPDALRPTGAVMNEVLERAADRALGDGGALLESERPEDWHRVRKRVKRLRYLLQMFGPLYPDEPFAGVLGELPKLQDRFGVLQDHVVQCQTLLAVGAEVGGDAALTAGALADRVHSLVHKDLRRCRKRWRRLERNDVRGSVLDAIATV